MGYQTLARDHEVQLLAQRLLDAEAGHFKQTIEKELAVLVGQATEQFDHEIASFEKIIEHLKAKLAE